MTNELDELRGDNFEGVLCRLTEVISWCGPRADLQNPQGCLRSEEMSPHPLEDGRKRVVGSVAARRIVALSRPNSRPADTLGGGRLLIYEPDVNLFHGLEADETGGYVDLENVPAWDTWVAYVYEPPLNDLVSWVPRAFVSLVSAGIAVCPEQCIRWLDEVPSVLGRLMRNRELR